MRPKLMVVALAAASLLGWAPDLAAQDLLSADITLEDRTGAVEVLQVVGLTPVVLLGRPPEALTALPADLGPEPRYGALRFGEDALVTIIVDRSGGSERVLIDANDDRDLSNDPPLRWEGSYAIGDRGQAVLPRMVADVSFACEEGPVTLRLILQRFERSAIQGRTTITLHDGILVTVDSYRSGALELGDRQLDIAVVPSGLASSQPVFGNPANALVVDLNGDGVLDGHPLRNPRERFRLGSPFVVGQRAFEVTNVACDGRQVTIREVDRKVVEAELLKQRARQGAPSPGQAAPVFSLASIAGDSVRLSDYRGKVVLLDFWATWCGPCRVELPYVKRAYERFHVQGFEIIGVSLDNKAETVERFVEANDMPWPQILQGRGSWTPLKASYGVRAIPAAFLIGPDGTVIAQRLRGERLVEVVGDAVSKLAGKSD